MKVFSQIVLCAILMARNIHLSQAELSKTFMETNENFLYTLHYGEKLPWIDAFTKCKAQSANLVSIDSMAELEYLRGFLTRAETQITGDKIYWTAGSDIYEEGRHIWMSNGKTILNTSMWAPGQPDNASGIEHCFELRPWSAEGKHALNDGVCSFPQNFICKQRISCP